MLFAYDAAYLPFEQVVAAKPVFVSCYTDGDHAYTPTQIADLRAEGISILANHENAINELLGGYQAGIAAAMKAMPAVAAWGAPQDGSIAIFYSVDLSVSPGVFGAVGAAFDGINHVHAKRYLTGVYGEGALIEYLWQTGRIQVEGWLSASSSFPGYNPLSQHVGLVQQVGSDIASTDMNVVTDLDNLGLWWATPHKRPRVNESEDDMGFRIYQDPRSPAQWAVGNLWAVGMASAEEAKVWATLPDCVDPGPILLDATHWDQLWRTIVYRQQVDGQPVVGPAVDTAGLAQAIVKLLPSNAIPEQQLIAAVNTALSNATFTGTIGVKP